MSFITQEKIPTKRLAMIERWPSPFLDQSSLQKVDVEVHGVALSFVTQSQALAKDLQNFFPKSWQKKTEKSLSILWQKPLSSFEKEWDLISDPDCHFHQDFISQRDFLAKKIHDGQIELMAKEKIDDGLFNFLRSILPLELLSQGKVLFHSSCVVNDKGHAALFFGPSGAGKTTIASLCDSAGGKVLGDDMNLLVVDGGKIYVEAAAVGQRIFAKENFGQRFELKKAFWLQKGPLNRVRSLETGNMGRLLSSFANLFWDQMNPTQYQQLFELLSKVRLNIETVELEFNKKEEVWGYVQSVL